MKLGYGFAAAVLALALYGASAPRESAWPGGSTAYAAQGRWDQQAEENFWLGRGMGSRLMTQEEWREHQQKMQGMTAEERQRYREEWHQKMFERARERGIKTPETPGPHRGGPGGAGMGPGGGMGPKDGRGPGGRR
jgi:hypothetical protein